MKSVTEFSVFTLQKGLNAHNELTAGGKSPEEIAAGLGETFKMEGDKLKHFVNSLEVAKTATSGRLKRILVVTFAEGEKVAEKAVKVEETYYLPEFHLEPGQAPKPDAKAGKGKGKGGRDNKRGGDRKFQKKRPEDPAEAAELKKFASSDGRAEAKSDAGSAE